MRTEQLPERLRLPEFPKGLEDDPEAVTKYLYRLVREFEVNILPALYDRINGLVSDSTEIGFTYSRPPNPITGEYQDGTWRQGEADDGTYVLDKKIDGDWVNVNRDDRTR